MLERIVSATEARVHFGDLLRRVVERGERIIVARDGAPQVVILAVEEYERLRRPEGAAAWEAALARAAEVGAGIEGRRRGAPLPEIADVIRAGREERDDQLDRALGLR
jgi:prevent-host-death family protein